VTIISSLSGQVPFQLSPATSIHPSDSISQTRQSGSQPQVLLLPKLCTQPAIRPSQYPFEVIWNLEDCQHDPDVDVRESNKSRPSMERVVRQPDGTMITDSEWSAIKSSARRIANELAGLPDSSRKVKMRRTKMYYRTYHTKEWTSAIIRLEAEQPLLTLCASNWKAEHVLGNSIQAILTRESNANSKGIRNKKKQKAKSKGKAKAVDGDNNNDSGSDNHESNNVGGNGGEASGMYSFLSYESSTFSTSFSGDADMSHPSRRASPPPQSTIDTPMESPTSITSNMKRPGPSSPHEKRSAKKHRGEQQNGPPASQFNWMAPLTASSAAGANPKATATSTSPITPFSFIHVDSTCMYYPPYEM
jgi:hypothetical protein